MAQQEEGWPLGLQPLSVRIGLVRDGNFSTSVSFNTLLTGSPLPSTDSSSDLDTESTGSFFHEKSITLGSLIAVATTIETSRKLSMVRKVMVLNEKKNTHKWSKRWFFSLCSRDTNDSESVIQINHPSLSHFLAVERRATNQNRRNQHSPNVYGPDELALAQPEKSNLLFANGLVAPPKLSPRCNVDEERRRKEKLVNDAGCGLPILFSCVRG